LHSWAFGGANGPDGSKTEFVVGWGGIYYLSSRMGLMLGFFLLCRERSRRISTSEEG
jgi:hypothetical protein